MGWRLAAAGGGESLDWEAELPWDRCDMKGGVFERRCEEWVRAASCVSDLVRGFRRSPHGSGSHCEDMPISKLEGTLP